MDTAILAERAHRAHTETLDNLRSIAPEGEAADRVEELAEVFGSPHTMRELEPYLISEEVALLSRIVAQLAPAPSKAKP